MSYRIDPRLPLTSEIRRIAAEEIEAAIHHLAGAGDNPDKALHECRKRLKSVRSLLRLVRSAAGEFVKTENARYREVSAKLAGPRDAAALIETLDRLAAEFPEETSGDALEPVRDKLVARHAGVLGKDLTKTVGAAAASCRTGLTRLEKMNLPDHPEAAADILADGVRVTMRRARKALEHAKDRGDPGDFHDLRKAVKAHAKHLTLLKKFWPSPVKPQLKALDALGERLGELHDILVLRALAEEESQPLGSRAETRALNKPTRRSERKLRKVCLIEASELFRDGPKRSARKVARKIRQDMAEHEAAAAP